MALLHRLHFSWSNYDHMYVQWCTYNHCIFIILPLFLYDRIAQVKCTILFGLQFKERWLMDNVIVMLINHKQPVSLEEHVEPWKHLIWSSEKLPYDTCQGHWRYWQSEFVKRCWSHVLLMGCDVVLFRWRVCPKERHLREVCNWFQCSLINT